MAPIVGRPAGSDPLARRIVLHQCVQLVIKDIGVFAVADFIRNRARPRARMETSSGLGRLRIGFVGAVIGAVPGDVWRGATHSPTEPACAWRTRRSDILDNLPTLFYKRRL